MNSDVLYLPVAQRSLDTNFGFEGRKRRRCSGCLLRRSKRSGRADKKGKDSSSLHGVLVIYSLVLMMFSMINVVTATEEVSETAEASVAGPRRDHHRAEQEGKTSCAEFSLSTSTSSSC